MTATEGLMIAGMAAVTFGVRYLLFALADRIRMRPGIEASLKFIPPAVLIAIILPAVLLPQGGSIRVSCVRSVKWCIVTRGTNAPPRCSISRSAKRLMLSKVR